MQDTFNSSAAAPRTYTLEDIARNGTAAEIASKAAYLCADKNELKIFADYLIKEGRAAGGAWRFKSYLEGVTATLQRQEFDLDIYNHCGQPLARFLKETGMSARGLDVLLGDGKADTRRQAVLDCALRAVASNENLQAAATLVGAGAKASAYSSRALRTAALHNDHEMFRFLCAQGADIDAALATTSPQENVRKFTLFLFDQALQNGTPEDYRRAAGLTSSASDKKPVINKALALFKSGEVAPLRQFMRGYLAFKRDEEHKRVVDDGYKTLVAAPLSDLLINGDDPPAILTSVITELPLRDRQTLSGILLRELCAGNGNPYLIATVLASCGGDVGVFANMPLSLAIRHGHTELALMLVRDYGANVGEAVLDAQLNNEKPEVLQKLYTFMAACQMQGLSPMGSRVNLKPLRKSP